MTSFYNKTCFTMYVYINNFSLFMQIVKERQEDVVEAENEVCTIVIYF